MEIPIWTNNNNNSTCLPILVDSVISETRDFRWTVFCIYKEYFNNFNIIYAPAEISKLVGYHTQKI